MFYLPSCASQLTVMPLAALLLLAAASPALASCPAGWLVELSTRLCIQWAALETNQTARRL